VVEPLLRVRALDAGYGEVQVLWQLDLEVASGEIACIVGANGAGKSTLLRTLSGLVNPRGGRIDFAGRDIAGLSPDAIVERGIAHVPEGRRLFRGMSVRDNLLLGAYMRTAGRRQLQRDLDEIYTLFPVLGERQRQDATTLSGGEQQMCAIGRGLMARPQLLLIDELSLGLSPRAVESLAGTLTAVHRTGIAILLVEQDVATAFELASRGYVIETGRVAAHGPTRALADDPRIRQAYLGM
jgi:branched-chain amino acid transport system ATP-binding protein